MRRTFTAPQTGPVTLGLDLGPGDIRIFTDDRDVATVTVEPVDPTNDREAERVVREAVDSGTGEELRVFVPQPVNAARGAQQPQQAADLGGIVISSGGTIIVDGQVINDANRHGRPNGAVQVTAWLPENSSVRVTTDSALMRTGGHLHEVFYRSTSGDLDVLSVGTLEATTLSGDIKIGEAGEITTHTTSGDLHARRAGRFNARSLSGDVAVEGLTDQGAARTTSGDVTVRAIADATVTATTASGDIQLSARPGVDLSTSTHTFSGQIQLPRT